MKCLYKFLGALLFVVLLLPVFVRAEVMIEDDDVFKPDDTLEEIRAKIDYYGFDFTVDHNWVFDMSPEEKEAFFSRHHTLVEDMLSEAGQDIGPLQQQLEAGVDLPSSFDWRDYGSDHRTYIGPVRQQGSCGACYSFGACAAAECTYNFATGRYNSNCVDFSESFIAWCLGRLSQYNSHFYGCNGADYTYSELEALCNEGLTYESYFPYQENDPGSCTHWSDPRVTFESWHRIPCNDIDAIKTAIMTYGVVDAAVYVDSAFQAYSGGIFNNTSTSCYSNPCYNTPTNHAISLVGWDDNGGNGYWILRNSWGTSWGENGYMRISYTAARVACEACYLVYTASGPTPTPEPTSPPADILLVDDDNNGSYESYYTSALDSLGEDYDVVTGSPTLAQLNAHDIVIWFTGDDYTSTLTSTDTSNLTSYLNNGGKLFITGQDIGYDINGDGTFMQNYLHATYVKDDTNYYDLSGNDFLSGTNVTIEGSGGAGNQGYPSAVNPANGGSECFHYTNGDGSGGICYSGTYKVVYFSFGFEAINSSSDRVTVMNSVLNYLNGSSAPTPTPVPPTSTPVPPTATVPPPTSTPTRTPTPVPPTATPVPPTNTPRPTNTPSNPGSYLLVDDDKGKSYETYYEAALNANGYSYTRWNVSSQGSPSLATLNNYDAVIWFTGDDYTTTLTSTDQSNLSSYLDGGGRLFITGQDIGYDIRTESFYGNYLHASYVKDDTNYYTINGSGILAGVNVTASGTGGANNQGYPSAISAIGGADVCMSYANGDGAAGVSYSGGYRVVYLSFGFEAINSSTDRNTVMQKVMTFLGGYAGPTNTPVPPTATPVPPTPTPAGGKVLLVDDDGGKSYETYYKNAITAAGYNYDVFTVSSNGPSVSTMQSYDGVVWFTGDDWSTTLTATDQSNLQTYLNSGGRLFITGQDIGYDIRSSSFYGNYLKAVYKADDTNNYDLYGVSGSAMGGINVNIQGGDGANNQNYPSSIDPASGANPIFTYSGGSDYYGGLSYSGTYKLIYLSFGFEAIDNSSDRTAVMNAALNFILSP